MLGLVCTDYHDDTQKQSIKSEGGGQFTLGQLTPGLFTPGQFTPGYFNLIEASSFGIIII